MSHANNMSITPRGAEEDFRVNLEAELEIRHLHSELDQLETQQLQTEMLGEISSRKAS